MHALRTSSRTARLVLAWFLLTLGAATVAPLLQPASTMAVCSADGGTRPLPLDIGGAPAGSQHALDCPLCLPVGTLAPPARVPAPVLAPLAGVAPAGRAEPVAPLAGAPLPARGPPARS